MVVIEVGVMSLYIIYGKGFDGVYYTGHIPLCTATFRSHELYLIIIHKIYSIPSCYPAPANPNPTQCKQLHNYQTPSI